VSPPLVLRRTGRGTTCAAAGALVTGSGAGCEGGVPLKGGRALAQSQPRGAEQAATIHARIVAEARNAEFIG
jgi:hypothetical protein